MNRNTFRYESIRDRQDGLRIRIRDIAQSRFRYGYQQVHQMRKREGIHVNHNRVYRLYREEGLQIRAKRPRGTSVQPLGGPGRR